MDDIYGIRRRNFDRALALPVMSKAKRQLDKAARLGQSPSMFAQLKNPDYKIGDDMARRIEAELGLEPGWMDNPAEAYQDKQLDLDRLGVALTAIDKALRDMEVQGKIGTLAEAVKFAYAESFDIENISDRGQMLLFDKIVATKLGGWYGQRAGSAAEGGAGEDRQTAPEAAQTRFGGRKR